MKKLKIKIFVITGLLISTALAANSQEWKTDLRKLNETYLKAKSFSMDVVVESYERAGDVKPFATYSGSVAKQDENYFTSIVGKTTIQNERCVLVIDNRQKLILYKENTQLKKNHQISFQ